MWYFIFPLWVTSWQVCVLVGGTVKRAVRGLRRIHTYVCAAHVPTACRTPSSSTVGFLRFGAIPRLSKIRIINSAIASTSISARQFCSASALLAHRAQSVVFRGAPTSRPAPEVEVLEVLIRAG